MSANPVESKTVDLVTKLHMDVIAPATLPEGYAFEAEVDGQCFQVKVPKGGVKEGEIFSVSFDIKKWSTSLQVTCFVMSEGFPNLTLTC